MPAPGTRHAREDGARGRPPRRQARNRAVGGNGRLTGCRKGEIVGLKRTEVDGNVLRLGYPKTGPRTVWLSEPA